MLDLAGFVKLDFYRFIMIFGFVIFGCFYFIPEYMQYQLFEQKIRRQSEIELIQMKADIVDNSIKINDVKDKVAIEAVKTAPSISESSFAALKQIEISASEGSTRLMELQEKINALQNDEVMENFIENKLIEYKWIRRAGVCVGFMMMLFGLYRWFKIQALLDKQLRQSIVENQRDDTKKIG